VGATPFGPYGNYSGLSLAARRAARRNGMAAHASAALRAAQSKLDELDAFVSANFGGPWAAAGIGAGRAKARKHFLAAVAGWVQGGWFGEGWPSIGARVSGAERRSPGGLEGGQTSCEA
jgi:hypothetical protein